MIFAFCIALLLRLVDGEARCTGCLCRVSAASAGRGGLLRGAGRGAGCWLPLPGAVASAGCRLRCRVLAASAGRGGLCGVIGWLCWAPGLPGSWHGIDCGRCGHTRAPGRSDGGDMPGRGDMAVLTAAAGSARAGPVSRGSHLDRTLRSCHAGKRRQQATPCEASHLACIDQTVNASP